jgi:hypothetical protein
MNNDVPRPRWYRLAADRLVGILLAMECVLWLSERLQWPHWHKGYAVLTVVTIVGVAFMGMLFWFVVALFGLWRFQFSIRSLLAMVVVVAIPCSWMTVEMKAAEMQREALKRMDVTHWWDDSRAEIGFDYQFDAGDILSPKPKGATPGGPKWLRDLLSDDFFADVIVFDANNSDFSDKQLEHVKGLRQLKMLFILDTKITDRGLEYLIDVPQLEYLYLDGTSVTDIGLDSLKCLTRLKYLEICQAKVTGEGLNRLQEALPNCRINR